MTNDTQFDLIDDELSDEALDGQRERICMASCGCQKVERFSGFCR